MLEHLARLLSRRYFAWLVVSIVVVIAAASALFARHVEQEDDLLAFLPRGNKDVALFYEINKRFGGLDVALIGLKPQQGSALNANFLEKLQRATQELKDLPGLDRVLSLTNLVDFSPDHERGGIIAGPLLKKFPQDAAAQKELLTNLSSRDHVLGHFVAADGSALLLYCFLGYGSDPKSTAARIRQIVDQHFPDAEAQKFWGGNPFISSYIYSTTQADIRRLTPWAALAIIAIMMLIFRDILGTCLALVSTGLGILISLGLMSLFKVKFNIVLGAMPIIMLALGSAYAIHVLARYYTLAAEDDTETAIRRTITSVGPSLIAAGLTTVVSLLSFVCMDIQPLRIFGLFTALGLFIKLILSLTLIPAVVRLIGLKRRPSTSVRWRALLGNIAGFVSMHRLPVGGALLAASALGFFFAARVEPSMSQRNFFSAKSPPAEAETFLAQSFGGSEFVQVHLRGDMTNPAVLREIQLLGDEMSLLPSVSKVMHVGQIVSQLNEAMSGEFRIPDTADQVKLLYTFVLGDAAAAQLLSANHQEALIQIKIATTEAKKVDALLVSVEKLVQRRPLKHFRLVPPSLSDEAATPLRRQAAISRLTATAHQVKVDLTEEQQRLFSQELDRPFPNSLDLRPLEQRLRQFLLSEENAVPLPAELVSTLSHALVKLGPAISNATSSAVLQKAIAEAQSSLTADQEADLAVSLAAPLREIWRQERARQHAQAVAANIKLKIPEGIGGEKLRTALAMSLLDYQQAAILMPADEKTTAGSLVINVSGLPVMNRGLAHSVAHNQLKALGFALFLVLAIMMMLFRSWTSGILAATPAMFSMLLIYGLMGLQGIPLDIGTSLLASIILGASVDYAIHFLTAWRTTPDRPLKEAAVLAADRTGLGIWTNALMISAGFFVLTLGEARPLKQVGGLSAGAMLAAAAATYLLVPLLARRRVYRRHDSFGDFDPAHSLIKEHSDVPIST